MTGQVPVKPDDDSCGESSAARPSRGVAGEVRLIYRGSGAGAARSVVRGDENSRQAALLGCMRRRLLRSHHRAASEIPDRARRARSGERGAVRVLGGDDYGAPAEAVRLNHGVADRS